MPLPDKPDMPWPPEEHAAASTSYRRWAAWWSGDVAQLATVYGDTIGYGDAVVDGRDRRPALAGARARTFHGSPPAAGALQPAKLHIPLAGDIAMTSADLLFGEPPALIAARDGDRAKVTDTTAGTPALVASDDVTQDMLDEMLAGGLEAVLMESAEIASAFGGVYLRVGWDAQISPTMPLFDAIPPDAAVPEFRSGQLIAVTFHRALAAGADGKIYRHLERHEPGRIFHGLYVSGDDKTLGKATPLDAHPETAAFAALVDATGMVETGATGLAAEYVPNMRPNRRMRGLALGRSDYDGIEAVMDALDESWSSWMRDLRIGKGRLIVPEFYLDGRGRGRGALFDMEQEVFEEVNAPPTGGAGGGLAMTVVQFQIRVAEHQQTCSALTEQAVRGAGYSAQSFGLQGDGGMATATEVNARQSRSFMTRGKKVNYYRPPLRRIALAGLQIAASKLGVDGLRLDLPDVEWPDGIATDPQSQAQTLQLLKGAAAASTQTRVETLHPDWDRERVDEEVRKILDEEAASAPVADVPFPGSTVGARPDDGSGDGYVDGSGPDDGPDVGPADAAPDRPAPAPATVGNVAGGAPPARPSAPHRPPTRPRTPARNPARG